MQAAEFEALKSTCAALPAKQQRELLTILKALTGETSITGTPQASKTLDDLFYSAFRSAILSRTSIPLPFTHSNFGRIDRLAYSKLHTVAMAMEQFFGRTFPGTKELERQGLRVFFCNMAISSLQEAGAGVIPIAILDRLAIPEQLADDRFPGYRQAGMLFEIVMRHIGGKHVRNESNSQARAG